MEQRVLDGLLANQAVLQVALLDKDGFVANTAPRHDDTVDQLAQAVGPLDASGSSRLTVQGEHACVMAQRLKANRVLVLKCEIGSNLGSVRASFDQAITALNALVV
ncbi:MAG: hypothetical protein OSA38_05475 [Candidatus Poseidoniaceae archaeon]|nr:hypothetical protein [Candidatus Poseidoniaceae archaeon]